MSGSWTPMEEDLLIENLELGQHLDIIADSLGRTPSAVALKMIHLYQKGALVIMAEDTFDVLVKRIQH
ncbi:MAG: SANT/Myb-like DNA-binding domain-containing protein [Poseidonia sp.]